MSHTKPQVPKTSVGRKARVTRTILDSWPLLVWIAVLLLTINAYRSGASFRRMNGTVGVYQESIAPLETGRLLEITVRQGETVDAGTVVARMDTALIDKKIAMLQAKLAADREDRIRRYRSDASGLASELRELKLDQAGDEAELAAVNAQLEKLEADLANRLIQEDAVEKVRVEQAKLAAKAALYPGMIAELETAFTDAQALLDSVIADTSEESADSAEQQELQLLVEQRNNMNLTAIHGGGVYRVEKEAGEVVNAGEAVVRIVARPEAIVAFLPQEQLDKVNLSKGDTVWVSSTSDRHSFHKTEVVAISPRMSNTPDRSSPLPNKMLRGREVTLALPVDANFLPGQTVIVNLSEPGRVPLMGAFFE